MAMDTRLMAAAWCLAMARRVESAGAKMSEQDVRVKSKSAEGLWLRRAAATSDSAELGAVGVRGSRPSRSTATALPITEWIAIQTLQKRASRTWWLQTRCVGACGWRHDDGSFLRFALEDEESDEDASKGEGQDRGRVWLSPQEIARAHNQAPPLEMDDLPSPAQAMLFNATEIVAQSRRDSCPCRHHPSECLACRGVPRVMFPDSDADESWPEITRHEFRTRFPQIAEPAWPADQGVYVPDSDLVWWTPYLS